MRLVGQRLYFGGDHAEAAAGLAGARGLDGRVERQHVGLRRDALDQADERFDVRRPLGQRADHFFAGREAPRAASPSSACCSALAAMLRIDFDRSLTPAETRSALCEALSASRAASADCSPALWAKRCMLLAAWAICSAAAADRLDDVGDRAFECGGQCHQLVPPRVGHAAALHLQPLLALRLDLLLRSR